MTPGLARSPSSATTCADREPWAGGFSARRGPPPPELAAGSLHRESFFEISTPCGIDTAPNLLAPVGRSLVDSPPNDTPWRTMISAWPVIVSSSLFGHRAGVLRQTKMTGDGRTADRHRGRSRDSGIRRSASHPAIHQVLPGRRCGTISRCPTLCARSTKGPSPTVGERMARAPCRPGNSRHGPRR
jgi:hypothetical protein